jgi:hypothetical protein
MEQEVKLEGMVVEDIYSCDEMYRANCGEDEICECEVEDHREDEVYEEECKEWEICGEVDV